MRTTWHEELQRAERLKRTRYVVICDHCGITIPCGGAPAAARIIEAHRDDNCHPHAEPNRRPS